MDEFDEKIYDEPWIAKNIGITRETLAIYRGAKYNTKNKYEFVTPETKEGKFTYKRCYSKRDIQTIMKIKMLVDIGYSLKEAKQIEDEKIDFRDIISEKIEKLEREKEKIENLLGVAKMMKITGLIPICNLQSIGDIKYKDYLVKTVEQWNVNNDPISPIINETEFCNNNLLDIGDAIVSALNLQTEYDLIDYHVLCAETLLVYKMMKNDPNSENIAKAIIKCLKKEYELSKCAHTFGEYIEARIKLLVSGGDIAVDLKNKLGDECFLKYVDILNTYLKNIKNEEI